MPVHAQLGPAGSLDERRTLMVDRRMSGQTLQEIATTFGVGRERVRQILAPFGLDKTLIRKHKADRRNATRPPQPPRLAPKARSRAILRSHKAHRRQLVSRLRLLGEELGRTPTTKELSTRLGVWQGHARYFIGRTGRQGCNYALGLHRWMRLAGLTPRTRSRSTV